MLTKLTDIKRVNKKGYTEVQNIEGKWELEHRAVVERFIGRRLTKEEVVHHINELKYDNSINNLMIFKNQREHSKWHVKLKQTGYHTNPMKLIIKNRWKEYKKDL
jgi:hypothetical protein